jgi:hypothetical protein
LRTLPMSKPLCAACGMPAHRYGANEGPKRYDPISRINGLLYEIGRLKKADMYRRGWVDAIAKAQEAWDAEEETP